MLQNVRGMFLQKSSIIAMLVPSIKHPFFSSFADCIEKCLYENGYKMMLCSTSGSIERERDYLSSFKSNLIDGVVMAADMSATAFYEAAQKLGKKIPEEFCAVAYDGTYAADMTGGKLTAIVQQLECIAEEVVNTILRLLRKEKTDAEGVFVPVQLRREETT